MTTKNARLFKSMRENTIKAFKIYVHSASTSHFLPKLCRFINKMLYPIGLGSALNRYDNSFTLYSSSADKRLYSFYKKDEKFINFGSGAFFHSRWKNYDYPGQSPYYQSVQGKKDEDFIAIDLCKKNLEVPEAANSVALIYCSHTLEHLDKASSFRFLSECFRMLKEGGVIRVALPNTKNDFYLMRCLQSQRAVDKNVHSKYILEGASHILADTVKLDFDQVVELLEKSQYQSDLFYKNTIEEYPEMAVFNGKNPERHINYWDLDCITDTAKDIGFSCVIPAYQGSSVAPPFTNLHVFDTTEPHIAFYADIIK